jgi:hypothetical protein
MQTLKILFFISIALFSLSSLADVTVQTDNGYDQTFADPNLKEDAQQDMQYDRSTVEEDANTAQENHAAAEADGDARNESGRR